MTIALRGRFNSKAATVEAEPDRCGGDASIRDVSEGWRGELRVRVDVHGTGN